MEYKTLAHLLASDSSSHPSQKKSPWAETRSENVSCTSAPSAKDKGPTGDFASSRELRECPSHGTDFALLAPPLPIPASAAVQGQRGEH